MMKHPKTLNKCLYCGIVAKKNFCSASHKTNYYVNRRIQHVNEAGPEEFIKRELDKPVPTVMKRQEIDMGKMLRLVPRSGVIGVNTCQTREVKFMDLDEGDLIEITIQVLRRKKDEANL